MKTDSLGPLCRRSSLPVFPNCLQTFADFVGRTVCQYCAPLGFALALFLSTTPAWQPAHGQETITSTTTAGPAQPSNEDVHRWVEELGSDSYPIRQKAFEQLLSAGMIARDSLLSLAEGTDPETRASARRLVTLIDRSEFRRRLESFAADTDGRKRLTLPGWETYSKLVGHDAADRALFVEMQRQEGSLLSAVFGVSKRAPDEMCEVRLQQISQWQPTVSERSVPPLGSCATMYFLGAAGKFDVSDASILNLESLTQRPPIHDLLSDDASHEAVRRLLTSCALNCASKTENALFSRLRLIAIARLEGALSLPSAVVEGKGLYARTPALVKGFATLTIGQLGKSEQIEVLEPLLSDASVCMSMRVNQVLPDGSKTPPPPMTVQIRDVALVALAQLTHQSPTDYGFPNVRLSESGVYDLQSLYRNDDDRRAKDVAKWRDWRASHQESKNDK